MIAATFDTAHRLFGITFTELEGLPVYHPDVRVWEARDANGRHVGLFLGDYFARPSKRSGAWMSAFRSQEKLSGDIRPIIVNVMNFSKGGEGEPSLLSFDDARTLFHEFGHALHGLLSDVTYPLLSGTSVARDFVEFPSQLYEHWLERPEVLGRHAVHAKTGEPMPTALLERLLAARTFNQGFATVEYTASAIVDLDLHLLERPDDLDVMAFERTRSSASRCRRRWSCATARRISPTSSPATPTRRATTAISGPRCSTPTVSRPFWKRGTLSTLQRRSGCMIMYTPPGTCAIRPKLTERSAAACR